MAIAGRLADSDNMSRSVFRALAPPVGALIAACAGCGDSQMGVGNGQPGPSEAIVASGARRLSRVEYDNTLRDLLGDTTRPGFAALPEDVHDPFDNDQTTQLTSGALIEAVESLADDAVTRLLADPARRDRVIGCAPAGAGDEKCLRDFIARFGRLALRRPLAAAEVDELAAFTSYAVEASDFYLGAGMVIRTLLQDMEFLYRVEIGTPVAGQPGLYRLGGYEMASRLSYTLWGAPPDDALLTLAAADALRTPEQIRAAATRLLADPRARDRLVYFHSLWLGYAQLPEAPDIAGRLLAESGALVNRVVFDEQRPWLDIFRLRQTYVDAVLAARYGLPAVTGAGAQWVDWGDSGPNALRKGILSESAFLSVAGKFGDTSPTQRGLLIRNRLLCQTIPPPPPNVNTDVPPTSPNSKCKWDRYAAHRSQGSCAGCHDLLDPVGFGLENFDQTGLYRATDTGAPECTIAGQGELAGIGKFQGPAGLSDMLIASGTLDQCMVTQLYRFAMGRRETAADAPSLADLTSHLRAEGRLDQLLLDLVASDWFAYRRDS